MLSLSTCWNSHRLHDGESIVQEALDLGFEYIEVSHGLKITHLPGILDRVKKGEIKVSSVHNFCPSPVEVLLDAPDAYEFTAMRVSERERALVLTEKTIETTARLGADRVVVHLGSVGMKSYTEQLENLVKKGQIYTRGYTKTKLKFISHRAKLAQIFLDRARTALDILLPMCEEYRISLGIETRSHFEQVPSENEMLQLMEHYHDCPWIGFWHDFGHVQRKANLGLLDHEEFLSLIAPRLIGCHIHDVTWPAKDHRVPFTGGCVEFDNLIPMLPEGIPHVWELSPGQRRSVVAEHLPQWHRRFGHLYQSPVSVA